MSYRSRGRTTWHLLPPKCQSHFQVHARLRPQVQPYSAVVNACRHAPGIDLAPPRVALAALLRHLAIMLFPRTIINIDSKKPGNITPPHVNTVSSRPWSKVCGRTSPGLCRVVGEQRPRLWRASSVLDRPAVTQGVWCACTRPGRPSIFCLPASYKHALDGQPRRGCR